MVGSSLDNIWPRRFEERVNILFKTSKTHGPHRRNNKSEYQECTCKMDKSLNRGMFNKFESRKICVAGYQCDYSDFDFALRNSACHL